ncbi:MAG: Mur ligase family protein [Gemmatimonadales bacterium]
MTFSLDPTRALLAALGNPETQYPIIHVGGTNGKGSVCWLVAEALRAAGWRTALYTSPHLVDLRERMLVDGQPIRREALAMWTERLRPVVEREGASFFEETTAIAFADFAARRADVAVVEVGLGGRLDATNVVTPVVTAITRVRREHTEYLGESIEGIAREKAGIAKPAVPLIVGERDPSLVEVIRRHAEEVGAPVMRAEDPWDGPLALVGAHQRENAAVALGILRHLPADLRPSADAVAQAFARTTVHGRFDARGPWLFDVAHNPDGVDALCAALAAHPPLRPLHAIVGILADKDWPVMLQRLHAVVDRLWMTDPPSAPADRRLDLALVTVPVEPDFDRALATARVGAGTVLVTGSFHTVGDAMARLPGFAPLD